MIEHLVFLSACSLAAADIVVLDSITAKQVSVFRDVASTFGRAIPDGGLTGRPIKADPLNACHNLTPAPVAPPHLEEYPAIAVIARYGGCDFEDKVRAAQRANFSAAIIFNINSDRLVPMGGTGDNVIPSVFMGYSDALVLLRKFVHPESDRYLILITGDEPFDIGSYVLPFAIVVGICFLVMLCIVLFKCIQDHRQSRRHRLPRSALKKLPIIRFKPGDHPYDTCCVCLEDFAEGDKLRILPCSHGYHSKCIDPWLVKNKRICPQCRKKVFHEAGDTSDSSASDDETAPLLRNQRRNNLGGGTFAHPTAVQEPNFVSPLSRDAVLSPPSSPQASRSPMVQHSAIIHASVESLPNVRISSDVASTRSGAVSSSPSDHEGEAAT